MRQKTYLPITWRKTIFCEMYHMTNRTWTWKWNNCLRTYLATASPGLVVRPGSVAAARIVALTLGRRRRRTLAAAAARGSTSGSRCKVNLDFDTRVNFVHSFPFVVSVYHTDSHREEEERRGKYSWLKAMTRLYFIRSWGQERIWGQILFRHEKWQRLWSSHTQIALVDKMNH